MKLAEIPKHAVVAAAVVALCGAAGTVGPASAATRLTGDAAAAQDYKDRIIERAFRDVLNRQPHEDEARRYRRLMDRDGWTEDDIRRDLNERDDYRSSSHRDESRRYSSWEVDRIIRRAYQDILGRDADPQGLRTYRGRMLDEGWTEHQVRDTLRDSPEARSQSASYADRIVKRAYQDVLGRDPDPQGLRTYRANILDDGWEEQDVRAALQRSPEARQKRQAMSEREADDIVRRAYQNMLGRDPDPGAAGYRTKVLREHWTQADVERELRKSAEYRNKQ